MIAIGTEATPTAAKCKGKCRLCDEPFSKGEIIVPVRQMKGRTRWGHVACAQAEATGTPVPSAPTEMSDDAKNFLEAVAARSY